MADMRRYAGGGPDMRSESAADYQQAGVPGSRITPTPEEVRRAQEVAWRAQVLVNQSVGGWGGSAEALHRAARDEAASQIAAESLSQSMYGQSHGVAEMRGNPGKMFSRETICAVVRAQIAREARQLRDASGLHELLFTFENLE